MKRAIQWTKTQSPLTERIGTHDPHPNPRDIYIYGMLREKLSFNATQITSNKILAQTMSGSNA